MNAANSYPTANHGSFNTCSEHHDYSHNDFSTMDNSQHHTSNITVNGQRPASSDILREYAVVAASYDSQEQQATPLCLSGTRGVILARISKWADANDESPICWLHGPGGSGKTTIAATLAKKFACEGRLAGTFFFSRESAHPGRRTTQNLVATIAYQLSVSHPAIGREIHRAVRADPTILVKSLRRQLESLILVPTRPYTFPPLINKIVQSLPDLVSAVLPFLIFCFTLGTVTQMVLHTFFSMLPIIAHLFAVRDMNRLVALRMFSKSLPMVIILDGLDECVSKDSLELIKILAHSNRDYSACVRFFVTSRAEDNIQGRFRLNAQQTHFIDLMDFRAHDDIQMYFQEGFSALFAENEEYMKSIEKPWPSTSDLRILMGKSEGLFVYASTLLKFVGDLDSGEGVPSTRLKKAMLRHDGLDGIYHQVFRDAPHSAKHDFKRLFGALLLHKYPLPIDDLARLLGIGGAGEARQLLRGCKAILRIPDSLNPQITLYHASLQEFMSEESRSKENYIDPLCHHVYQLYDCFQIMALELEVISRNLKVSQAQLLDFFPSPQGGGFLYACRNWCYHLKEVSVSPDGIAYLMSHFSDDDFCNLFISCLDHLTTDWFPTWASILGKQSYWWGELKDDVDVINSKVFVNPGHSIISSSLGKIQELIGEEFKLCLANEEKGSHSRTRWDHYLEPHVVVQAHRCPHCPLSFNTKSSTLRHRKTCQSQKKSDDHKRLPSGIPDSEL